MGCDTMLVSILSLFEEPTYYLLKNAYPLFETRFLFQIWVGIFETRFFFQIMGRHFPVNILVSNNG